MAGRKSRANRIRSWFLLKGSVISILIMCLNILITTIFATPTIHPNIEKTTKSSPSSDTTNSLLLQSFADQTLLPISSTQMPIAKNNQNNKRNMLDNGDDEDQNSDELSVQNLNRKKIGETIMLPKINSEWEAQQLYEKTLKEYGVIFDGRTTTEICELWKKRKCKCNGELEQIQLQCRKIGLIEIPKNLPDDVIHLDLGSNNITSLPARAFEMVPNLEELIMADNFLKKIDKETFSGLNKLKRLSLQNCGLTVLPGDAFKPLSNLASLFLTGNALTNLENDSLINLHTLRTLRLEKNLFYRIPTDAIAGLKKLEALNLGSNLLTIITTDDFPMQLINLVVLLLKRNQIHKIAPGSFSNLTNLKILELDHNLLRSLPIGLNKLVNLQEFTASGNRIECINETDLPKNLQTIDLRANPLKRIKKAAFQGMTRLRKLILSDVQNLKDFPNLDGCLSLEILRLDRAGLTNISPNLCRISPRLKSLELKLNRLTKIPNLGNCRELKLLDLSRNQIETLNGKPFEGMINLHDLLLSYNKIKTIPSDAFVSVTKLQILDLEGNEINFIHHDAFSYFGQLEDLNLGNNIFPILPSTGLNRLLHLKTFNNPRLRDFPNPEMFPRIQTLVLSYAYHCCPFLPLIASSSSRKPPLVQEAILFPSSAEFDMSLWNSNNMTDLWPQLNNMSTKFGPQMNDLWDNFGQDFVYPGNLPAYVEEYFEDDDDNNDAPIKPVDSDQPGSIQCLPMPGPFLPCADLFDWWTLRFGVWIVFLLAMLGNGTVVFVLLLSRSKIDVPRFLVVNLAIADFFMGVYLGILAIVDASTLGEFRMFAIPWQMSIVCQMAGFFAVFSSELSVYTLAVITLERNYAITNAIHLNKRLNLKQATYIMIFGWIFALMMAILPLIGISDYRKFAICLPFETTTGLPSLIYVISLMIINGCAFLTLMGCYLKMYWAIRGSQAWNTNDSRIAKRMALLVFTDFLCWSPIAFFSLTAIFGLQLISLEQAKIFTVFILPLNSCCNPFLYAIMTKQFKKDCIMLCKSLEEQRVSKTANGAVGVGRERGHDRRAKELPPLLPNPHVGCRCLRMLPHEMPKWQKFPKKENLFVRAWNRFVLCKKKKKPEIRRRAARPDQYTYQFAEIKGKKPSSRASSISSENFCSSRSSSWKNGQTTQHNCPIPLRMLEPSNRRRHSAWLITRKTSQDSTFSSSRNDSSASATTASTSTFRLSRSSASSTTPLPSIIGGSTKQLSISKPRLVRQHAVQEEEDGDSSPPRLGVRFLPTIPSAADSSIVMEDENSSSSLEQIVSAHLYAVLEQGGNLKATISSPKDTDKPP